MSGIAEELHHQESALNEVVNIFRDALQQYRCDHPFGYVYIERINEKNQQERDVVMRPKVIALIEELRKRFRYEDIAILTRDNSEVELITSWCLEAGFPVESEKTLNVIQNPLIKEIISFLRFLYSPPDNLSFASFILGELLCRAAGLAEDQMREFVFGLHRQREEKTEVPLYRIFRHRYPELWAEYIEEFFKNVGFVSVYELVTGIYRRLHLFENFTDNQAFFMKFLELIKAKEDEYVGLGEFLAYLENALTEDLYVTVTHSDSLKILTVHKSKGLEFPVVIIPFLRMDITPETAGRGTSSYVVDEKERGIGLLRITKVHRSFSPILEEIYCDSYKRACIDELNNIYVALTRAQFELYLFIPRKSGGVRNKAYFLVPDETTTYGEPRIYDGVGRISQHPLLEIPPIAYKDWLQALRDEFGDAHLIKNRERIREGTILHAMLSRVGNCVDKHIDAIITDAISYTQAHYPFCKDIGRYAQRIKELITHKDLKDIFYVEGKVYCEKEVVNRFGDLKRIDRLIVKEKDSEVWVVDYKSSQENREEHLRQVADYVEVIKSLYPQYTTRGFLVYLDEMRKEELNA